MWMQGAGAIELVPWPHADQAHEWSQSIQSDFSLNIQVAWTRLSDVSNLHYHTEVSSINLTVSPRLGSPVYKKP